jgi:hypothetical protein
VKLHQHFFLFYCPGSGVGCIDTVKRWELRNGDQLADSAESFQDGPDVKDIAWRRLPAAGVGRTLSGGIPQ